MTYDEIVTKQISELANMVETWTADLHLATLLLAQIRYAERLLSEGLYDAVRTVLLAVQVGIDAVGPFAFTKNIED